MRKRYARLCAIVLSLILVTGLFPVVVSANPAVGINVRVERLGITGSALDGGHPLYQLVVSMRAPESVIVAALGFSFNNAYIVGVQNSVVMPAAQRGRDMMTGGTFRHPIIPLHVIYDFDPSCPDCCYQGWPVVAAEQFGVEMTEANWQIGTGALAGRTGVQASISAGGFLGTVPGPVYHDMFGFYFRLADGVTYADLPADVFRIENPATPGHFTTLAAQSALVGALADYWLAGGASPTISPDNVVLDLSALGLDGGDVDTPITAGNITVTAPAGGVAPDATATVAAATPAASFTVGNVTWDATGDFDFESTYTASVTLTAATDFTFDGLAANTIQINGVAGVHAAGAGNTLTVTRQFTTEARPLIPAIGVSPTTHTFPSLRVGYAAITPAAITVTSTGTGTALGVAASLTGAGAASFEIVDGAAAADLAEGTSREITVRPITGLAVGTHTATLTISSATPAIDDITVTLTFVVQREATDGEDLAAVLAAANAVVNNGYTAISWARFQTNLTRARSFATAGILATDASAIILSAEFSLAQQENMALNLWNAMERLWDGTGNPPVPGA